METPASLHALAERIDRLPLIDSAVNEILSLLNRTDSNFTQIADRLSPDLALRFLNMANIAHPEAGVRSLKHAMGLLGYAEMKQILTTAVMVDHFTDRLDDFRFDRFQQQARFCAAAATMLGTVMAYPHLEDLFTASILHNVGKLVIAVYFPEAHGRIVDLKCRKGMSTCMAEIQVLGHGHAEIGALVLRRFNVPEDICEAVRFHNVSDRAIEASANFQLEFICREAARLVGRFALPDAAKLARLRQETAVDLDRERQACQLTVRQALRENGFVTIFVHTLVDASRRVEDILTRHIPLRTIGS
ncbi:MAG: HDOD domain-containing protein [Desulfobacterales bacterium]|nr:HDOD domain-containing protein [Desulfobacterales bacterium]